ncbi:hypothetical protein BDZ89DRAFT_1071871 [Hymenopellis radicata]|nr:hypothetical protein BDZ89DRAFT_1071871 [Hymenopellis radicata]
MPALDPKQLAFSSVDGKTWKRMLYGQEAQAAWFVDAGEGFTTYAGTLTARFNPCRTQADLQRPLAVSWMKARHLAPSIATIQVKRDGQYWYEYEVPTLAEVHEWVSETIFWHEEPKTILEVDLLMEDKWWKCADGHHLVELHLFPSTDTPGDWHITYLAPHNGIDARSLMKLMEYVLTWTLEELKSPSTGDPLLDWGSETPKCRYKIVQMPKVHPFLLPDLSVPFLPSIVGNTSASANDHNNAHVRLTLTKDETTRYREVCRANGVTATDLWLALLALSEIEYTLQSSADAPEEAAQTNIAAYEQASHFLFGFYFINHRHKLPGNYKTLQDGALLFGCEGTNLLFDMNTMRKAIVYDRANSKVVRDTSRAIIWDGVVQMSHTVAKGTPADFTAVLQREIDRQAVLDAGKHDDSVYHMRVPMLSSIGDYTAMDILNPFVPGTGELSSELSVLEQCHSIRVTHPLLVPICWQYAGRLDMLWSTGRRWQSQENLELYKKIFKEWLDIAVGSV